MLILVKREKGWLDEKTERSIWTQTALAYGVKVKLVDELEQELKKYPSVIFCEPPRNEKLIHKPFFRMHEMYLDKSSILVFGNSACNNLYLVRDTDSILTLDTPNDADLWGFVAFGIIMEWYYGRYSNK